MPGQTTETSALPVDRLAPLIHALAPIGVLVTEHPIRDLFLAELPPDETYIARAILQDVSRLQEETGWNADALIQHLGCPSTNVGEFRKLSLEEYKLCHDYIDLLCLLTGVIETAPDKRMLILGFGNVYLKADKDIEKVRHAFTKHLPDRDALLAIKYLELGEIRTALNTVLAKIDPDYVYSGRSPFDDLPSVHISTGRIDVLVRNDPQELEALGEKRVVPCMRSHIDKCKGCHEAFQDRYARLIEDKARAVETVL